MFRSTSSSFPPFLVSFEPSSNGGGSWHARSAAVTPNSRTPARSMLRDGLVCFRRAQLSPSSGEKRAVATFFDGNDGIMAGDLHGSSRAYSVSDVLFFSQWCAAAALGEDGMAVVGSAGKLQSPQIPNTRHSSKYSKFTTVVENQTSISRSQLADETFFHLLCTATNDEEAAVRGCSDGSRGESRWSAAASVLLAGEASGHLNIVGSGERRWLAGVRRRGATRGHRSPAPSPRSKHCRGEGPSHNVKHLPARRVGADGGLLSVVAHYSLPSPEKKPPLKTIGSCWPKSTIALPEFHLACP
nr:hypothetical protein Iba_chr11bCG11630 [Ipomoea batatas]